MVTYFKQWAQKILRRGPAGESGRKPFVIDFNPWHYSDQNQLIDDVLYESLSSSHKTYPEAIRKGKEDCGV